MCLQPFSEILPAMIHMQVTINEVISWSPCRGSSSSYRRERAATSGYLNSGMKLTNYQGGNCKNKVYLKHAYCFVSQTSMPLQKKLIIQVERRMREVEAKDKELAVQYQSLEEARRQMGMANQRVTETIQSIRQTQTKAINLIQEKMEVEKQLQLKKQELQFLCTIHQDSEQLENIIRNKEEEIRKLQQRLHTVESELSSEKKWSQRLREQLRQVTAELETKSAVEREREKATGDLRTSLERERQTVDFLREQLTSASTSKEHMEVCKNLHHMYDQYVIFIVLPSICFPLQGVSVRARNKKLVNTSSLSAEGRKKSNFFSNSFRSRKLSSRS